MLALIQRDLRREARSRRASISRLVFSSISFIAYLAMLLVSATSDGRRAFFLLTITAFFYSAIEGVRLAAGSIADEKRDGTLALLFLTPLRPTGIIAAKFFSIALPVVQPFLTFIPCLALTALLGGVTGGEILRALAAICAALFLSIAIGLFVSSVSRSNQRVGVFTLAIAACAFGIPPLLGNSVLRYLSPATAFIAVSDTRYITQPGDYWLSLLASAYVGVALLVLSAFFLPRRWERSSRPRQLLAAIEAPFFSAEERARILERNPGEWLAVRESPSHVHQILFCGAVAVLALIAILNSRTVTGLAALLVAAAALLTRLASQSSFLLSNSRRSGANELLLCTPLEPFELIQGQVTALVRQFILPAAIIIVAGFFYSLGATGSGEAFLQFVFLAICFAIAIASTAALGMFIALLEKSPAAAFFQTILIGVILATLFSLIFPPMPYLLLLGLCANRLASDQLPVLLKRPPSFRACH